MSASPPVSVLHEAIHRSGYYPALVTDLVMDVLEGCELGEHLVHVETQITPEQLHRQLTVLVLTSVGLVVARAEDHRPPEASEQDIAVHVVTECVRFEDIRSLAVHGVYRQSQQLDRDNGMEVTEVSVSVAWSGSGRLDLDAATCLDVQCGANHGYTGVVHRDDVTVRVSVASEGSEAVAAARRFARALERARKHQHAQGMSR